MKARVNIAALAALAVVFSAAGSGPSAQEGFYAPDRRTGRDLPVRSEGGVSFTMDAGVFFRESGRPVVEVYLGVPYDELPFVRKSGGYISQVEVVAIFRNRAGDQVGGDSWRRDLWVEKYEETMDPDNAYKAVAEFTMPPGEYDLKLSCEGLGSNLRGIARKHLKVPAPPSEGLALSDPRMGSCGAADSTGEPSGESFVPSGGRSFGAETSSICVLVEAYSLEGVQGDSLSVEAYARDEDGRTVWDDSLKVARTGRETLVGVSVPMDSLGWGVYRFGMRVRAGDREASLTRAFEVDESRLGRAMDEGQFLDLMSLVASERELETLASLGGSERRAYIDEIWSRRDPDPGTPKNEFKIRFFKRLGHAKSAYAEPGRVGWKTDRGRVFIKNGPPDRVDIREGVIGSLSPDARLEIWYYDAKNTHYVFEDFGGTGAYTLVDVVQG